jgi:hypothetical protein
MKKLLFVLLIVPLVSFGQNDLKLIENVSFKKNDVRFNFKRPIPFKEDNKSFATDKANLVVSYSNREVPVIIQIYCTPIPSEFFKESNQFFKNKEAILNFINQLLPPQGFRIEKYRMIELNNKSFLEVESTTTQNQGQINWIGFYKNNMINILGTSYENKFNTILPFFIKFKNSLILN